jgi:hypothetical protein
MGHEELLFSGWCGTGAVPADPVRNEKGRTLFDAPLQVKVQQVVENRRLGP